jgi:diguanylate cyclase (GGDEF)-like protein/putative nucleotidyltransferase with HDIG domain
LGAVSLTPVNTAAIILGASCLLLSGLSASVYRKSRERHLQFWAAGWLVLGGASFLSLFAAAVSLPWFHALDDSLVLIAALALCAAARIYVQNPPAFPGLAVAALAGTAWCFAFAYGRIPVSPRIADALLLFFVAWTFHSARRKDESWADGALTVTFASWGALVVAGAFASRTSESIAQVLSAAILLPVLCAGLFVVISVYEDERRHIERNILALSNLNLATSSFTGSEIEKMLGQALERVLNVVRLPGGALCLYYGEGGPNSVVVRGLNDSFSAEMRKNGLNKYAVDLASRLGGLIRLIDLGDESEYEALSKEEPFRQWRKLLLDQQLRTVIGISLQAKQKAFGLLLLGTSENRIFSSAELKLLMGLGHQIGMAVENSYLVQQTSRRSEELHILNEIGRALSSTLDLDSLLERIYSEVRRLMDVGSFFIAFYEPKTDEIRYEIEILEGKKVARRSRPAGNFLVEHVIRTQQPLLIRERYAEEVEKLGFKSLKSANSLCAVPLILYDRAVGILVVYSPKERAFDEGHLELLRVLASEAGIAIENARLFTEEQKKSRHLTLINNVSGHAITTLNPDEMLAKIAVEIENSLAYEHIGIAILDYTTKELIIQAEAGTRKDAAGRRISLSEGMIGQVARTGQVAMVREASDSTPKLVLPTSVSSIGLPVVYAEQLLGVLYVESSQACDFPEQEVLLLRTLADLFAGALHNALTFQKAQEQAITDGLTGVKTHRFLMEALSAEWKRSTRANRPFALVLMDLDRFKFVNDFYGHLEGDVVLQRVGHILEQNCRRSDVVARYGGDEFVILMPETSVEQARQLAGKLRAWIASDRLLRDKNITASFGIAGFPVHGSTPQELIQVADSSMYLSKHQGGNAVSSAEQGAPDDRKRWKKDVLEAYLGVTLKRLFSTGPEAFEEIYRRLEQFTRSLSEQGVEAEDGALPPAVVETVTSLAFAIDAKDQYTQGHSQKVSAYAVVLAQGLAMGDAEVEEIRLAALLHDIGKVGIPEGILNKSGPLDAAEWETMKTHPDLGFQILETLKPMHRIRLMVRHHHECYDGSGYPERLKAENIPYGARVIAVADAYDTITSARSYKKPRSPEDAFAELERCASSQFDPEIVAVFIEAMKKAPDPKAVIKELPVHSGR